MKRVWWLVHNCIAHPWLGVAPRSRRANRLHDWTAARMGWYADTRVWVPEHRR